jgi:pyridinium-3,5-biscarboxylic acid mononucleotide sulfurtransferase
MSSFADVRALVRTFPSALLGYSGGVDSAVLAVVLRQELGSHRMLAVLGRSPSLSGDQLANARAIARSFDLPLLELDTNELADPDYVANPLNRCFFCKRELWSRLTAEAQGRGLAVVCDGTQADDAGEHRPGRGAGAQVGIRSPLAEVGIGKAAIRTTARALGLPIWDAPASPCLASRVAYGVALTPARLGQVEAAEAYLRGLGATGDLRVRHNGSGARIEAEPHHLPWLTAQLPAITARLTALGFATVELDPRGYRRGGLLADARGQ